MDRDDTIELEEAPKGMFPEDDDSYESDFVVPDDVVY